jgi:hypothetical protein
VSKQDVQQATKDQKLNLVEGSIPSGKKTAHRGGASNVEAPVPPTRLRENKTKKKTRLVS